MSPIKPLVYYQLKDGDETSLPAVEVGKPAYVYPINHTSQWVSNSCMVRTSPVVSHNPETGEFETENSRYKPVV